MADIKIDGKLFQERIGHFVNAWKADKRAGDTVFNGASSIVILMGKLAEDAPEFHKNNAVHVSPPYRPCAIAKLAPNRSRLTTRVLDLVLAPWL